MSEPSLEERRALCVDSLEKCHSRAPITLDGRPAVISGAFERFALVRWRDNGAGFQFAWSTVARIVAAGGRFQS